jgi:hypothetical protein
LVKKPLSAQEAKRHTSAKSLRYHKIAKLVRDPTPDVPNAAAPLQPKPFGANFARSSF